MYMKFKLLEVSMAFSIIVTLMISCFINIKSTYDDLQKNVLRMHILANSDTHEDQALKLKVRDALLQNTDVIFNDCSNIDDAEYNVTQKMDLIKDIANKVVLDNGYNYPVKVELVNMSFDDRTYDNITMPSGLYDAIRITIGKAEGHNWWCVMYPPMCVNAVSIGDSSNYFDKSTMEVLENHDKYKLKLKILEWLENKLK